MRTSEKIELFLKKGILISPDAIEDLDESMAEQLTEETVVLDRQKIMSMKKTPMLNSSVKILKNYTQESKSRKYDDFVKYFNQRYSAIQKMLSTRAELSMLTSINRVSQKKDRDTVSIIGMVYSKSETKNNNLILEVEDPTGITKVLISKDKPEIYNQGRDIVLDEVIGITGNCGNNIVFANSLTFPDVPLSRELKKGVEEGYAVFISDVEVGSKYFMEEEWDQFMAWLQGKAGDEIQKETASKIKYLFVVGDLVAGVGVYPGQDEELVIPDIKEQYKKFADYMKQVPEHIQVIVCAGNHDSGRITEPQPPLTNEFCEALQTIPNLINVSNPSLLNIEAKPGFPGFNVLLYHGYSIPYLADNIESVRAAGGQKRTDLVLEFYMKRRHLAPPHSSNLYIPDPEKDPLVIDVIPDILATGHVHRTAVNNYRGVTLLNCSAWTGATDYQMKRGLTPEPGRAMIVNLKTRKVRVMNFVK